MREPYHKLSPAGWERLLIYHVCMLCFRDSLCMRIHKRSPVRFRPKTHHLRFTWIWAHRPSIKGSKLLFPVTKANQIKYLKLMHTWSWASVYEFSFLHSSWSCFVTFSLSFLPFFPSLPFHHSFLLVSPPHKHFFILVSVHLMQTESWGDTLFIFAHQFAYMDVRLASLVHVYI